MWNEQKSSIQTNKGYVIPSEMLELKINLSEHQLDPDCKNLEVEVIPRPEVLIEED